LKKKEKKTVTKSIITKKLIGTKWCIWRKTDSKRFNTWKLIQNYQSHRNW